MMISREPLAAGLTTSPLASLRARPPTPVVAADLLRQAARAGDFDEAGNWLTVLLSDPTPKSIPADLSDLLVQLAQEDRVPAEVRAGAWAAHAFLSAARGDEDGMVQAVRHAAEIGPARRTFPPVVRLLAEVAGWTPAEQMLERGLALWPDDASLLATAAYLHLRAGDLDRAGAVLAAAQEREPDNVDASAAEARLALLTGRPAEAVEPARDVAHVRPALGRALVAIARFHQHRLVDDPGLLDAVLATPPMDAWVLKELAESLLDLNRLQDACTVLDYALTFSSGDPWARRLRGIAHAGMADYDAAALDLDLAARYADDDGLTALRGEVARMRGDYSGAVEIFRSIELEQAATWIPASLGSALLSLGAVSEAQEAFDRALSLEPRNLVALCGLAQLSLDHGGDEGAARAESLLRKATEADPGSATAHALLGETFRRTERLDESLEEFDEAIRLSPDYSYALASKGQVLIARGDPLGGARLLAEAARTAPTSVWILDELVAALESSDPDDADRVLRGLQREVRRRGGDILPLCSRRARLALRQSRWSRAERLLRQARELAPDDRDLALDHVTALKRLGHPKAALSVLDSLSLPDLDDRDLRLRRIGLLWELDRLQEAQAELESLVDTDDPPPITLAALGEVYRMQGRRDEGRYLLEDALRDDPNDAYTLASLGVLEADEGQTDLALRHLREAAELQPDYAFGLDNLMSLELELGMGDQVRERLERLSDASPADHDLALARAGTLYRLGEYSAALTVLDQSIAENGQKQSLLLAHGWVQVARGLSRRAAEDFLAAAKVGGSPSALTEVVDGLIQVDRWEDAIEAAARALKDKTPYVDRAVAKIWLGAGVWEAAVTYSQRATETLPGDAQSAHVAARALRMGGRAEEALRFARRATTISPRDVRFGLELAECLDEVGQSEEARRLFGTVVDLLDRRTHLDMDELTMRGVCLMRLRRNAPAADALLHALSAGGRAAEILLDMALLSLLDSDLRQTHVLVRRSLEELDRLPAPSGRGRIATALHDLSAAETRMRPNARAEAEKLTREISSRLPALDAEVQELGRRTPFPPWR